MTMIISNFAADRAITKSRQVADPITELLCHHARELIAAALEAEVKEVMKQLRAGGAEVVRNGYLPERDITTAIGDVSVEVPRIRIREGEPVSFSSSMIPKYLPRSSSISAWAAYAYLKGISEGDVAKVLEVVLGEGAKKLTPSVLSDLKGDWTKQFDQWQRRDLSETNFIYLYADGIYQKIRGDNPKICVLVLMGVDDAGKKHLIALEDGVRESTQSWREVLLGAKARGMNAAKLATGDGAMGFWAELSEVFASATHQRCWMHKSGNVMNYLPQSTRAKAKVDLHQIWMAGGRQEAEEAMTLFEEKYGAKYPRAVECLTKDGASLLAFYDFPPRALVTHSHHQPNRVHLRDAAPPHQTRQGCLLQRERTGHGVAVGARGTEALEPHHRS
jgi:putative transposase